MRSSPPIISGNFHPPRRMLYFYRSVGATTNEAIQYYLEHSQRKHWKTVDHDIYLQSKQKPITGYIA